MHVLIINGSPRVKEYSNTDKILEMFTKGLCENGTTFEQYEVSDVKQWKKIRERLTRRSKVIIWLREKNQMRHILLLSRLSIIFALGMSWKTIIFRKMHWISSSLRFVPRTRIYMIDQLNIRFRIIV